MEMEVEEIQENPNANTEVNRFARIGNGRPDDAAGGGNRLRGWHHSSRIIRVSRASGGKDRHSKVWTSKGLRDRRVRLSVTTAIQFYDLQDRLGYDQPSKAVEWLINAAAESISELPSLNSAAFPETPKQLSDDQKRPSPSSAAAAEHHHSSNSETSKGSGLSLSRSDVRVNRVKARERARERASKDKDHHLSTTTTQTRQSQNPSFTQLLTSGITSNNNGGSSGSPRGAHNPPMDYFPGRSHHQIQSSLPMLPAPFGAAPEQYSYVPEAHQLIPSGGGGDFSSQSFWIGTGFNRGTLQSNNNNTLHSTFNNHHFQRFSNDGPSAASSIPFLFGPAADHHHQFSAGFCYGADHKGKGKNS